MSQELSLVSVKYIGKRPSYIEGTYGTKIQFDRGDSRMVPADKARLMLKHTDVYAPGDADALVVEVAQPITEEEEVQDMRDAISNMDKGALAQFAKTHFNFQVDKRVGLNELRQQVTGMVDQFGVV